MTDIAGCALPEPQIVFWNQLTTVTNSDGMAAFTDLDTNEIQFLNLFRAEFACNVHAGGA
jgi:hypothetical protein